jgi:predicted DNA-binding transcriptional regulator AlpA
VLNKKKSKAKIYFCVFLFLGEINITPTENKHEPVGVNMNNSVHKTPLANEFDRIVREAEREELTTISRTQAFQLEKINEFPKRIRLSNRSVGWKLSEILMWIATRAQVNAGD